MRLRSPLILHLRGGKLCAALPLRVPLLQKFRARMATAALLDRLETLSNALRCKGSGTQRVSQREALDGIAALQQDALNTLYAARGSPDISTAARVLGLMARYWWMRGLTNVVGIPEALATLPLLLNSEKSNVIDGGLYGVAQLFYAAADYVRARQALGALSSPDKNADALNLLGMVEREQGHPEIAITYHQQARTLYLTQPVDEWGVAHTISNEGVCATRQGNVDAAISLHENSLAMRRKLNDTLGVASSLGNLAIIYLRTKHDYARAKGLYIEGLAMRESLGDKWGIAGSCVMLAETESELGSAASAVEYLTRAFAGFAAVGDQLGLAESAQASAHVLESINDFEGAVLALGVAMGLRGRIAAPAASIATMLEKLRTRIPNPAVFEKEKAAGYAAGKAGVYDSVQSRLRASQATVRSRRRELIAVTIGIALAAGATWYYFRSRKSLTAQ